MLVLEGKKCKYIKGTTTSVLSIGDKSMNQPQPEIILGSIISFSTSVIKSGEIARVRVGPTGSRDYIALVEGDMAKVTKIEKEDIHYLVNIEMISGVRVGAEIMHWTISHNESLPCRNFPFRVVDLAVTSHNLPKNNDGKDVCCFCGGKTRKCGGISFNTDYRICTKCGK